MNIFVLGGATTKFGELWNISPREMARQVLTEALALSGIESGRVDALFVGNMLSGILSNQANLGSFFAEELGHPVAAFRMEAACASGGMAFHNGVNSVLAGRYKTVAILGIEKMTDHGQEHVASSLMAAGSDEERQAGATFVGLYALMAQAYMQQYGATEEDLAAVSVKNHYHGSLNPKAQFQFTTTIEKVMRSPKIADPLKLLDCSPLSDGAAAVIISSDPAVIRKNKKPVRVAASSIASDTLSLHNRKKFTSLEAVVRAAKVAYKEAQVLPDDIDVSEVHDCFTIAEVMAVEDLGFSKKGNGAKDIGGGKYILGKGTAVVNPSGGLKSCGHPVGATGIKQIVEIAEQLRGESGENQHKGAKVGLTHNVGGSGTIAAVHIFKV